MMAMQPNWFDEDTAQILENSTAEEALEVVANHPRIIQAIKDVLADYDANPGRPGPSRTQVIRNALCEVLSS